MNNNNAIDQLKESMFLAARVATTMIDGDTAAGIVSGRALYHMHNPEPRYRFMASDYYDVDHARFLTVKKLLLRTAGFVEAPCGTAFWLSLGRKQFSPTVMNGSMQRYFEFGKATPYKGTKEMNDCCSNAKSVMIEDGDPYLTILTPVFDSLQDIAGFVEITTMHPEAEGSAQPWS